MTTKLRLFNGALVELGERRVQDTGENIETARELVAVYDQVVLECLSAGSWNFALETIKADADTGVEPAFGYTEVFAKPTDWIRTHGVSEDEYFSFPLLEYYDDINFWSADSTPIYIRYVSSDTGMGLDLTRWPSTFARYVELELACRVCLRLTSNGTLKEAIEAYRDKARKRALGNDAWNEPAAKFPQPNSWTLSRSSGTGRRDRGSRGSLIG